MKTSFKTVSLPLKILVVLTICTLIATAIIMPFVIYDMYKWAQERQTEKEFLGREEAMRVFAKTFDGEFPNADEAREMIRPDVTKKLVEAKQRLFAAYGEEHRIHSEWSSTRFSASDGVAKRAGLQKEFNKAEQNTTVTKQKFHEICRVALGANFKEEARAVGCPKQ